VNFVPSHATHNNLTGFIYLANSRIRRHWMVIFPDVGKTTFAFQGWVCDLGVNTPVSDALRASPTICIDGKIIFAFA
jgi:hypothetical protein